MAERPDTMRAALSPQVISACAYMRPPSCDHSAICQPLQLASVSGRREPSATTVSTRTGLSLTNVVMVAPPSVEGVTHTRALGVVRADAGDVPASSDNIAAAS